MAIEDVQVEMLTKAIYSIRDQIEGNAYGHDILEVLSGIRKELHLANELFAMNIRLNTTTESMTSAVNKVLEDLFNKMK